jgi:hypothetical protein
MQFQIDPQEFTQLNQTTMETMEIDFPVSSDLYHAFVHAMQYCSPLTLGVTAKEMRSLRDKAMSREKLNYYEYAVLSNNLEARTPLEMEAGLRGKPFDYFDVMTEAQKNSELFNIKAKVVHEQTMRTLVQKNSNKLRGEIKETPPMSSVKGEA